MRYIVGRLFQAIFVILTVLFVSFFIFRFLGNPVNQMVGLETTLEKIAELEVALCLDKTVFHQFGCYIRDVSQGNFGISYQEKRPALELILERMPATLELSFVSALFSLLIGIPLGVYTGIYRNSYLSNFFMTASLIGISLPTFLIGVLLFYFFSTRLGWLPPFGRGGLVDLGLWETSLLSPKGWSYLIMPAITLGLFQTTLIMRIVRSEMLETMRTDFIKFARARGISNRSLHYRHALKNTLIPVMTITGLQIGSLIAFAIITESVFQWPGMGLMFISAVQTVDVPVMAVYLMIVAFIFVMINLIVDLLYFLVDPRLRS